MAPAHETVIRAVGMALASTSAAFAIYMLAYGAGKTRINGMEHLAIFAQPRGPGGAVRGQTLPPAETAVDMAATGSVAASAGQATTAARPIEIVAAEADRVWLKIDGAIRTASRRRHRRGPGPYRRDRRAKRRLGPARRPGQGASRGSERRKRRLAFHSQAHLRISLPKRCRGNWGRLHVAWMRPLVTFPEISCRSLAKADSSAGGT
jgi:hypothetical protein